MKVAFTHNLRLTDVRHSEKEAEFDSVDTVNAIASAIEAAGHEVEKVEVSGPASTLLERGLVVVQQPAGTMRVATPVLGQAVHGLRLKKQVTVEKSTLRDHDFEAPMLDLHGEAGKGALERYEFPGGFVDPGAGKELAAIRLAQQQGEAVVLEGLASCPELAAGHHVSLSDAPEGLPDEPWLLLRVVHRIETKASATCRWPTGR